MITGVHSPLSDEGTASNMLSLLNPTGMGYSTMCPYSMKISTAPASYDIITSSVLRSHKHWGHLSCTEEFLLTSVRKQYLWASTIVEFQIICSVFSLGDFFFLLLSTYNDIFEVITSIYIFHYKLYDNFYFIPIIKLNSLIRKLNTKTI